MCGISGIISLDNTPIAGQDLKKMTDILAHRGPDGEGLWINDKKNIGLGHRRLSIIDLSDAGKQPMQFRNRYHIVFNGEIYNYLELRETLKNLGHHFLTKTDTEVLLAGYAQWNSRVLDYLDGMFSFAIWDEQEQSLFCARDRFGEKPFHYINTGKQLLFASEIKALISVIPKTVNDELVYLYLAFDLLENPNDNSQTFFKDVYRLPPAHYLTVDKKNKVIIKKYWTLDNQAINPNVSFKEASEVVKSLFEESVKRRLRSDVTVGTSLSGGIDSSGVIGTMSNLLGNKKINAFSARFKDKAIDEGKFIEMVTAKFPIYALNTWPDAEKLNTDLAQLTYHLEEPIGSGSVFAQWCVMQLAAENGVKVLLDGQGADEGFAGYIHYFSVWFKELFAKKDSRLESEIQAYNVLRKESYSLSLADKFKIQFENTWNLARSVKRKLVSPTYNNHIGSRLSNKYKNLLPPFYEFKSLNKKLRYDTTVYGLEKLLRFADRNSMAHSIEVRLPFLYHKLVEYVFTLPSEYKLNKGYTKVILREALANVLPSEIKERVGKLGFTAPDKEWLTNNKIAQKCKSAQQYLITNGYIKNEIDNWQALSLYQFLITFKL